MASRAPSKDQVAAFVEESTREQGVPLHVEDPETLQKVATLLNVPKTTKRVVTKTAPVLEAEKPKPSKQHTPFEAIGLLHDGYHVDWVAKRVGVPVEQLRKLVGKDGYAK